MASPEYIFEYDDNAAPSDIADSWQQMQSSDATNYVIFRQASEPMWLQIGGPDESKAISPDVPRYDQQSNQTVQPIYFDQGVIHAVACLERRPEIGETIKHRFARNVADIADGLRRDGFKVYNDSGIVWSVMSSVDDRDVYVQAFLNLTIPDNVEIETGSCYDEPPAGCGLDAQTAIDRLSTMEFATTCDFKQQQVDFSQDRHTGGFGGEVFVYTYEMPVDVVRGRKRPKYTDNTATATVIAHYDGGGTVEADIEAPKEYHDWLSQHNDVTRV